MNDTLFSMFFKRFLTIILPFCLLINFGYALGITTQNGYLNLNNSYFGFESFVNMVDYIGDTANVPITNFVNHIQLIGKQFTFNIPDLIKSILDMDVSKIIFEGSFVFFQFFFGPVIFFLLIILVLLDIIAVISVIFSALMFALLGVFNITYDFIYDLPPLVHNVILPMFL